MNQLDDIGNFIGRIHELMINRRRKSLVLPKRLILIRRIPDHKVELHIPSSCICPTIF